MNRRAFMLALATAGISSFAPAFAPLLSAAKSAMPISLRVRRCAEHDIVVLSARIGDAMIFGTEANVAHEIPLTTWLDMTNRQKSQALRYLEAQCREYHALKCTAYEIIEARRVGTLSEVQFNARRT